MATLEELERRLVALEERMAQIAQDAAAARVLAGGADRDVTQVSETLAAHTRVLNALRETQLKDRGETDTLAGRVDEGFGKLTAGMTDISSLLRELIDRQ
ncbi:hypothetical protein SacmaDRAFT_4253 [Saccharomonospora marina XMU15]|uniref:Uncharacterized protein n=1 Tax=Saccharomonospora marina XMU15 TaxID=882083 RepID=H5X7U3_9PSEU|nr:hypothetical protein [Saccharomonospora marina]EHR52443.1 hypothetical protein SacmaDRAFT_4253 [Saccharomonospora marina XMU15]